MRLVIVESPFAAFNGRSVEDNIAFARLCLRDCILQGEAPFASHLLYTQPTVLDDNIPEERQRGIEAGHFWMHHADLVAVYCYHGISRGMDAGIAMAKLLNKPVEYRTTFLSPGVD